mmetsp:Transcript_13798/g.35738  ORF Transcript_13798/g.35738 Transcript_13798/m.35738 type:complete len:285 (-) Transcript_13798:211-1065(-)
MSPRVLNRLSPRLAIDARLASRSPPPPCRCLLLPLSVQRRNRGSQLITHQTVQFLQPCGKHGRRPEIGPGGQSIVLTARLEPLLPRRPMRTSLQSMICSELLGVHRFGRQCGRQAADVHNCTEAGPRTDGRRTAMAEVATPKHDVALAHGDAAGREAVAPEKILLAFGQHDEVAVRLRAHQRSEDGLSMVMTSWPAKEAPVVLFLVGQSDAALHAMQPDGTEALVKVLVWARFHLGLGGAEEGEAVLRSVKFACAIEALEHPICNLFAQVAEGPARLVTMEHVT